MSNEVDNCFLFWMLSVFIALCCSGVSNFFYFNSKGPSLLCKGLYFIFTPQDREKLTRHLEKLVRKRDRARLAGKVNIFAALLQLHTSEVKLWALAFKELGSNTSDILFYDWNRLEPYWPSLKTVLTVVRRTNPLNSPPVNNCAGGDTPKRRQDGLFVMCKRDVRLGLSGDSLNQTARPRFLS